MPDWVSLLTGQTAAIAAALVGALVALWRAWRKVRPVWKGVQNFLEDWNGEPGRPGVDPRPGVMPRLATVEKDIARAADQLNRHLTQHQTG